MDCFISWLLASPHKNRLVAVMPLKSTYIPYRAPVASLSVFQKFAVEMLLIGARFNAFLQEISVKNMQKQHIIILFIGLIILY